MTKAIRYLLLGTVLVFPYLTFQGFFTPATDLKSIVLRLVAAVGVLLLGIIFLREGNEESFIRLKRTFSHPIGIACLVGVVLLLVSTVLAHDPSRALFGTTGRGEGFLTLFSAFAVFAVSAAVFDARTWRHLLAVGCVSALGIFIAECAQYAVTLHHLTDRADAGFGNPVFLAGYYMVALCFGAALVAASLREVRRGMRWLGYVTIATSLVGMLLTGTRAALLAVVVAVCAAAIFSAMYGKSHGTGKFRKAGLVILGTLVALTLVVGLTHRFAVWQHVPVLDRIVTANTQGANTVSSRFGYTKQSLAAFVRGGSVQTVLFGWGWDNFDYFWMQHNDPSLYVYDPLPPDRSHDAFVDRLVMTGLLGLLAYCALWVAAWGAAVRVARMSLGQALPFIAFIAGYVTFLLSAFDTVTTFFLSALVFAYLSHLAYEKP